MAREGQFQFVEEDGEPLEKLEWDEKYYGLYRADTPQWIFDGCTSEQDYEQKTVRLVDDLLLESKNKWKEVKSRWGRAAYRLEMYELLAERMGVDKTDLPLTPQAIEEAIALMLEGLSRPQPKARDASQEEIVPVMTHFFNYEMVANSFDMLMGKVMYNQKAMFMGIVKMVFEPGNPGPYSQDGMIRMRSVDPRYFHPDPLAKGDRFTDSRYWIFAEPEDTADVRARFPGKGFMVEPESAYTLNRQAKEGEYEVLGNYTIGARQRVLVKECWIRDDRKVFIPDVTEFGQEIELADVTALGSEKGKTVIQGRWLPKYPNGRLVVTAGNVVLEDRPNPFPHKEPPYTLFPARISAEIFSWSDVELLGRIEDKINRLHKDMIRNARVNMNAPWIADRNCFDTPRKFNLLVNDPGLVLPVSPGSRIERLPPAELPQFIFPLLNWLRGIFDDLLGVQAVMRGQLEKGSQLSAQAVENLQVSSTSRLRFKARLFEDGLKRLGHQLEWMIREFYDTVLVVRTPDPANPGKDLEMPWKQPPEEMGNFEIEIETGSGLPGSKENGAPLYLKLWQLDLIPRIVALQALKVPNAEKIAAMMDQDDLRQAALGQVQRRNKTGRAGRKEL